MSPFLILLILLPASLAMMCDYGQISRAGSCRDCPPGTFQFGNTCAKCAPGTYNPLFRAPDSDACRICPEDTFSARGSIVCTPCPPDTFSKNRKTCRACPPGEELNRRGNDKCVPCERGAYSTGAANKLCERCPFPLTGPVGSDSVDNCVRCPPGRFGENCGQCFRGWVWNADSGLCELCPTGTTSREGSVKCRKCRAGKYATFEQRTQFVEWHCRQCPDGLVSNDRAQTCRTPGKPCEKQHLSFTSTLGSKEFFENKDGNCESCRFGFFRDINSNTCVRCPTGTTSLGGNREKCIPCEGELVPDEEAAQCRCPQGRYYTKKGRCRDCPAGFGGSFANSGELRGRDGCIPCNPGQFSSKPGQTQCMTCLFGTVANRTKATSCTPCPKGTYPSFNFGREGQECVTLETGCPIGFKFKDFWGTNCRRIRA